MAKAENFSVVGKRVQRNPLCSEPNRLDSNDKKDRADQRQNAGCGHADLLGIDYDPLLAFQQTDGSIFGAGSHINRPRAIDIFP